MDYGDQYWYISLDDYEDFAAAVAGSDYDLSDFGTPHKCTRNDEYAGWYFDFGEISPEEMEWMEETFPSFDLRVVNLSVQAWFAPNIP